MIAVIKSGTTPCQLDNLVSWLEGKGLGVNISQGIETTIVGIIGDTSRVDASLLESMGIIESVTRVTEPFKAANRKFHPLDTKVEVAPGVAAGAGEFLLMAGPSVVEEEGLAELARAVRASGANVLSAGVFKSAASPYADAGLGERGLELLRAAGDEAGLPVSCEIMDAGQVGLFCKHGIDLWQVGARNMQNYDLLREVGRAGKPVMLRRGPACSVDELLMSAEHILSQGNPNVILCECGIRTFETRTRSTLDLAAVPALHGLTHLPVVVDPSQSTGHARFVEPMALAAAAAGADGVMVEVHTDPASACADAARALLPAQFGALAGKVRAVRQAVAG